MILDKIVADVLIQLKEKKERLPLSEMVKLASAQSPPLDFASALRGNTVRLIAEVKKASPSKGVICHNFQPLDIAGAYAASGAAAISVLTEPKYFLGSLNYLRDIKKALADKPLPLLRKDFIFDPYQVYEARAYGADSLLLIVAILTPEKLRELLQLSHRLGMICLVEVHNNIEVETALKSEATIIGINNRDLNTFTVDLNTTAKLRSIIPPDRIVVSESGIKNREDMEKLGKWGVNSALIGEALMSAPDIATKIKELL
ncbi:MAG: indole-3-glycerol phosphate synthase TrpC [Dehalococcoidales bacterium]|nr:indole-3-glycerol phosphate synthase TrpC [Dehalococcoidales bacterium]